MGDIRKDCRWNMGSVKALSMTRLRLVVPPHFAGVPMVKRRAFELNCPVVMEVHARGFVILLHIPIVKSCRSVSRL